MFTASEKKRENIAEYLLYMWHIEDLIRANMFDIDKIEENIINKYTSLDDNQKKDLKEWYESLIDMMKREGVKEHGHLQLNKNTIIQLDDLHRKLLANPKFADYSSEYFKTLPFIVELRAKAGENKADEIETAFNALYGIMMLRLAGKDISRDTLAATQQLSRWLALLSHYYKLDFNNKLLDEEEDEKSN